MLRERIRGMRRKLWPSFLPLMRSIGGWIRLRVVSFRGLGVGFFVGCAWVGSVLRLLLLVYSVCTRGALRCFLIKIALTYQKKKKKKLRECHAH
jgi:hypothetical protein